MLPNTNPNLLLRSFVWTDDHRDWHQSCTIMGTVITIHVAETLTPAQNSDHDSYPNLSPDAHCALALACPDMAMDCLRECRECYRVVGFPH